MRRATIGLLGLTLAAALAAGSGGLAVAGPSPGGTPATGVGKEGPVSRAGGADKVVDDLSSPAEAEQRALREKALDLVLTGEREVEQVNGVSVVKVGTKQAAYTRAELARLAAGRTVKPRRVDAYVRLDREQTDQIFVVLAEFGQERHPGYPDQDTDPETPGPTRFDGPLHNQIPRPDRVQDNSTIWQPDYSAEHYRRLYFGEGVESLKDYYQTQSSGRYSVDGEVTDWVRVRYNEARYGRSDGFPCATNVCSNTWDLLADALDQWVANQEAAGRTAAQIRADVSRFDQQDRYDHDGDGDFHEPDGYVDHFQLVHSGGDQADGDPHQGEDAIWSHRWKAFQNTTTGPAGHQDGGHQIGSTGIWVADYTIQPENGGLSVFAHEYGHDLGLPDHYDTAAPGDNPVSWWTVMGQSRVRGRDDVGTGTRPADLGVWDKLQLGWLDYEVAVAGQRRTFRLGPHEHTTRRAQGLVVVLPQKESLTPLGEPATGNRQWWSGTGHHLTSTLTRAVSVPAGSAQLTFQARWNIEDCGADVCDQAFVQVNDGHGWQAVSGSITKSDEGNAVEGDSGGWVPAAFDLSAWAGRSVQLRFVYTTDSGTQGRDRARPAGFFVDDVALVSGGTTVLTDGAESGTGGWTAAGGFAAVGSARSELHPQYYLASNRTYRSYDRYLRTGPYNYGFGPQQPDRVEHFPYETGLLVNYWDTSYRDNNTSVHPGHGLVLPVDAHPGLRYGLDGQPFRGRIQTYDAPFSLKRPASFTLHVDGRPSHVRGRRAQPLFDDTRSYWREEQPRTGVKTPGVGVTLRVTRQRGTSMTVRLGSTRPVSPAATLAGAREAARD